jgi:hypothetical protein
MAIRLEANDGAPLGNIPSPPTPLPDLVSSSSPLNRLAFLHMKEKSL